ncbi:MAG: hypothetical protein K2G44_07215 [Clostridia bacterium]|nr:hypothetical protein [Clostridia bacterium]
MKEIFVPSDGELQYKKKASFARRRKAGSISSLAFGVLAVLCLLGAIVCIVLTEIGERSKETETLLYILSGSFAGGAALFAAATVLISKIAHSVYQTELDFRERCDSENSFFVGEGTLATFEKDGLRIHAESGKGEAIKVPYLEIRFFSVCTRHLPREKGEWSVVIEVPAKYLAKAGEPVEDGPALIQADAKERLYRCIENFGLTMIGGREDTKKSEKGKKFSLLKSFVFPDRAGRKRILTQIILGVVAFALGIGLAFWQLTVGIILGVFGSFIGGRAVWSYIQKKSVLYFYEEGIYWKEEHKNDSVFLKWEEIESISEEEKKGYLFLKVTCPYGSFYFLSREGVMEFLGQNHPEKCVE